jgi:hypothetical protein
LNMASDVVRRGRGNMDPNTTSKLGHLVNAVGV